MGLKTLRRLWGAFGAGCGTLVGFVEWAIEVGQRAGVAAFGCGLAVMLLATDFTDNSKDAVNLGVQTMLWVAAICFWFSVVDQVPPVARRLLRAVRLLRRWRLLWLVAGR